MRDLCVEDARQKLHLEAGPGTHFGSYLAGKIAGVDWRTTFRSARHAVSRDETRKFFQYVLLKGDKGQGAS